MRLCPHFGVKSRINAANKSNDSSHTLNRHRTLKGNVMFWVVILTLVCTGLLAWFSPPAFFMLLGILLGLVLLGLISVFYKDWIAHDPSRPWKLAWMVKVPRNRSVVIQRGGRPMHVLRGDEDPVPSSALFGLWMTYKAYVMSVTGYHVYFPFFTGPTVYAVPRYEVKEEEGKKKFFVIDEDSPGYLSNHVRTELTTWYFEYSGAEVQKIPFTIKGSVQIVIPRGKEEDALYKTDSWNVLLDQALNSVIRSVVRGELTLEMVIGGVENDLWETAPSAGDVYMQAATLIQHRLVTYAIDGMPLSDIVEIKRVDIIDFADELSTEESKLLRSAVLAKEVAKGDELKGRAKAANIERAGKAKAKVITAKGQAERSAILNRGKATAEAQALLAKVHKDNPELAAAIIDADAKRAFADQPGGIIDAVAATLLKERSK